MQFVLTLIKSLAEFIYPHRCSLCDMYMEGDTQDEKICIPCKNSLRKTEADFSAPRLRKVWFDRARSVFVFEGNLRQAIHGFKYAQRFDLASMFATDLENESKKLDRFDVIVPVPLHRFRIFKRGYNQSAILAKSLAKRLEIPYSLKMLVRKKEVGPQVGKDLNKRVNDVKGIFDLRKRAVVKDRRILLIDDVMTTGATVNECARALKKAGAKSVQVLTVARTL